MSDSGDDSQQWQNLAPIELGQVSDERRNDYFYEHRPYEHFIRSLAVLRLITTRSEETLELAEGLDESWLLEEMGHTQRSSTTDGDSSEIAYVVIQGLTLKFLVIETLLRHFLAHRESPTEPWSHISQLKVPRHFSERVRSGTLDITEGPPPMRQWTVPAEARADA